MKKVILISLCGLFILSCSKKEQIHDPLKNEFMAYTQKFESVKENDRYLGVATYLNPVMPEIRNENEDEFFLLSVYPKEITFDKSSLKVNGSDTNITITELSGDDPLMQSVAFNLPWSKTYKITSPKVGNDNIVLSYHTSNDLNAKFSFRKVSKSMYWNPKIKLDD